MKQDEHDEQLNTTIASYEEVIAPALHNYKKEKFAEAISDFNFILKYFPFDLNAQFHKALCDKNSKQYQKTIDALTPLTENNSHTFYQEAKWHLALCYGLTTSGGNNCKKLLSEIISEGGFYKDQAKKEMSRR